MITPLVFDIKRTSTTDGPGVRTVVFFKGCSLDCFWCHNPEGKSPVPTLACFREKCVSCGNCRNACKNTDTCIACGACADSCPTGARRLYGRAYSIEELLAIIERDLPYYDATGGGVTFSGGECMLYPAFLASLAKLCRKKGISVAVDTAGYVPFSSFEAVFPFVDLFLYDIKAIDPVLHEKGTGVRNELILENLDRLIACGGNVRIRIPQIPAFNLGAETEKIKKHCEARALSYECLPYHAYGESKREAIM